MITVNCESNSKNGADIEMDDVILCEDVPIIISSYKLEAIEPKKYEAIFGKEAITDVLPDKNVKIETNTKTVKRHKKGPRKSNHHISDELRQNIITTIDSGICSRHAAAVKFELPYTTVVTIYKDFLRSGKVNKKRHKSLHLVKVTNEVKEFLRVLLAENCKYKMKELKALCKEKYDVDLSLTTIARCTSTFQFNIRRLCEVQETPPNSEQMVDRQTFCRHFMCVYGSERSVLFLAEADFEITMRQWSGRARPGVNNEVRNPYLRHRDKTVMVTMSETELLYYKVANGQKSYATLMTYLKELFAELETRSIVGAVLIIDDAIFYCYHDIKETVEAAGHLILILTESCQFMNPAESVISLWPNHIRAMNCIGESDFENAIGAFSSTIDEEMCKKLCQKAIDNIKVYLSEKLVSTMRS